MSSNLVSDGGQPFEQGRDAALNGRHHSKSHAAGGTEASRDDPAHTGGRRYAGETEASRNDLTAGVKALSLGQRAVEGSEQVALSSEAQQKAGVIEQSGQIVQANPAEPRDLFQYATYKPSRSPSIVYGGRYTMYYSAGDQALYAAIERRIEAVRWVQIMNWNNNTPGSQQYQVSYTTGLKITQGSEITTSINIGAAYEGFSMGVDFSYKTFKSTETTSSKTITLTVNVPAYSQVVFYQKAYDFVDYCTFVLDAWGQEWNVGPWGGYNPLTYKDVYSTIMAEEYFTNNGPLPAGPGTLQVDTVPGPKRAGTTRKRENCTERCKDTLARFHPLP